MFCQLKFIFSIGIRSGGLFSFLHFFFQWRDFKSFLAHATTIYHMYQPFNQYNHPLSYALTKPLKYGFKMLLKALKINHKILEKCFYIIFISQYYLTHHTSIYVKFRYNKSKLITLCHCCCFCFY